jgi:hypothetical protein
LQKRATQLCENACRLINNEAFVIGDKSTG